MLLAQVLGQKTRIYARYGKKAVFQGGRTSVADVFSSYANYERSKQFLKLTSCNTTGLIRAVDCLDRVMGIENVIITIIRRVADPGDYHRGLTNALQVAPVPNHQAVDLMLIMPHIKATGVLVHTPVTHGHIISVVAKPRRATTKEEILEAFDQHPRIRVVRLADGFLGMHLCFLC